MDKLLTLENDAFEEMEDFQDDTHSVTNAKKRKKITSIYEKYANLIHQRKFENYHPEFIVDRAEGLRDVVAEQYNIILPEINDIHAVRVENLEQKIQETRAAVDIAFTPPTKKAVVENYIDRLAVHTNDKQNVHDSNVNKDVRKIYDEIRNQRRIENIDHIKEFISTRYTGDRAAVLEVLNRSLSSGTLTTVNDTELNLLLNVWNRALDERNTKNETLIKEAVIDNLANCWENGTIVCMNGRCNRILSSLVLLDFDDKMGKIQTTEQYKNEVYDLAKKTFDGEIIAAKHTDNPDLVKYATSFEDLSIDDTEIPIDVKDTFKLGFEQKIDSILEKYKDNITPDMKNNIMAAFVL
ncbi:MAG: hypothetical protein KAS12_06150 [Candidatus Aenigmarchaeota archaeon]|nr:hypothetical protein [Candidatus Aenigmarchaeota archaeon]